MKRPLGLVCLLLAGVFQFCTPSSAPADEKAAADAFEAARAAFDAASTPASKLELAERFLESYPDSRFTVRIVRRTVADIFQDSRNDPQGAVAFAERRLAPISDPDEIRESKLYLIELYGLAGKVVELRRTVDELGTNPDGEAALAGARASKEAEEWELAFDYARKAFETFSKPADPSAEKDKAGRKRSETRLAMWKSEALTLQGQSLVETMDLKAGLAKYAEAAPYSVKNFAGVGFDDLPVLRAEALLLDKDPAEAMNVLAVDALIGNRKEALELYRKAYLEAGNAVSGWQGHRDRRQSELAKSMIPFEATDYRGKVTSFTEQRGKVTLVAFWFPT